MERLGNHIKITNGFAFKSSKYSEEGARIIRITNVQKGIIEDNNPKYYTLNDLDNLGKYKIFEGDILMSLTGNVGRVGKFPKELLPAYINQRVCRVKSSSLKLDDDYLFFILNSNEFEQRAINSSTGIAQLNLSTKWIEDFKIPLPPLTTQKRIAQILDNAAALRDKTQQLLTEYDQLAQSIFLEMFGDVGNSNEKNRFIALKKLITQKPDNGFFAKKNMYGDEGLPIVWLNNFLDKLYVEEVNLRRAKTSKKDEKYLLEYGDALFCRSSLTAEGIGKCAIVPKVLKEKTLFECHIIRLRFDLSKIVPEFFRFLTNTRYFRANIEKRANTSTMTTISQDGIAEIKIPVPPIHLQNQFAEKIALIEQQKALAKQELQESEDLFNCLLQKAFKGELV